MNKYIVKSEGIWNTPLVKITCENSKLNLQTDVFWAKEIVKVMNDVLNAEAAHPDARELAKLLHKLFIENGWI